MAKKTLKNHKKNLIKKNPVCEYCLRPVTVSDSNLDHVMPVSRGGKNAKDNLVLTHIKCNSMKGNFSPSRWKQLLPALRKDGYFAMSKKQRRKWRDDRAMAWQE